MLEMSAWVIYRPLGARCRWSALPPESRRDRRPIATAEKGRNRHSAAPGPTLVDEMGKIVREVKVASEPEALLAVLANPAYHFKRIGLEAGPLHDPIGV